MGQDKIDILERALAREKAARKQAEKILESKAAELYEANRRLEKSYTELEALLNRTDSQLQGVFENIVDAYVIIDLMGNILKINDAAVTLLGFESVKENFNLLNMVPEYETMRVQETFKKLFTQGAITNFHVNIITKDNRNILVHINASIIYDEGVPVAAQGIVRDITKEKEAERHLIESENRLATLIQNLGSGVLLEDENRKIVLTNIKFCELFNIPVSPEILIGQDCSNSAEQSKALFEDPEGFVTRINEIVTKREKVLNDEIKMVNGVILERDYIPIFENNTYKGHLWKYTDVTLKRKYRKNLEIQKEKYSNIIANMNLGLVEVDNDGRIIMVNHSFIEMSGYSEKELIGKIGGELFSIPDYKDISKIENEKHKKGESNSYEIKVKNKKGEILHWLISSAPNYNFNGEITGSIGIHLDITDIKSLELQKEKLLNQLAKSNDELQEYAHIVSHDLKSPLRSINALVNWIKQDNIGKLNEVSLQNFSLIDDTVEKMENLISDILSYSSIGFEENKKEDVNVNEVVKDIVNMLHAPESISINIIKPLPIITGYKTKLQQLFQNLISNAIKFTDKEHGIINVSFEDFDDHYQFSVQDNGIGIDDQFHDKIFKVFHSLKKSKYSTGIGLSIVQKIVHLHEGKIWLKSKINHGTTFYFTLKK
ncbi:PAS domain S-box protein [Flavobacteriaceae bacterium XHP0103]|uniref:PAS domain S-box protein n=1 Tax=Marixanthotalea marina TaxID=2844359 RepID=UPI00298A02C3|nr:PAS domain S-box protein [Marixanthotalea marina]MBU3821272.1 PAS domain S-box protein [Marixanthotalea marina]